MKRWWPLLAVVAMLILAGVAAATAALPLSHVDDSAAAPIPTSVVTQAPREVPSSAAVAADDFSSVTLPAWVMWVLGGLVVAAIAGALIFGLSAAVRSGAKFKRRAIRRTQPQAPAVAVADVGAEVVAAVEAGLVELDETEGDPRRAVIACWVRLERAATAAGTPREKGDTPTDLVLRLLAAHHLSIDVLTGFAEVYRQARYSTRRAVDAGMRDQARYALRQLRGELTGVAA